VTNNGCLTDTVTHIVIIGPQGENNFIPERIVMYPVPANESLMVRHPFNPNEPAQLEIIDVAGKCVVNMTCVGELICVPVEELQMGTYTMRIAQGAQSTSQQVSIQR
jgi:hypothetical protein